MLKHSVFSFEGLVLSLRRSKMSRESISQILLKVGEGKRWESIADLIEYCNGICEALGPICHIAGGAFGWKFSELIPMLENEQELRGR